MSTLAAVVRSVLRVLRVLRGALGGVGCVLGTVVVAKTGRVHAGRGRCLGVAGGLEVDDAPTVFELLARRTVGGADRGRLGERRRRHCRCRGDGAVDGTAGDEADGSSAEDGDSETNGSHGVLQTIEGRIAKRGS